MIWLRAETKAGERRSALSPAGASELVENGTPVTVERSENRIFTDAEYAAAGCGLADAGSWTEAPADAWILGLKELNSDETNFALTHTHVYFGHAYKGQPGADALLGRFTAGGGRLLDLEFLEDEHGRRIAAFGYWAGYAGCLVGAMMAGNAPLPDFRSGFTSANAMVESATSILAGTTPHALVIGSRGRCGSGALDAARAAGLEATGWDIEETRDGGPFEAILDFDVLINCVLLQPDTPPFLTPELVMRPRKLHTIVDVSCDPGSPWNPLPIYEHTTTLADPVVRLVDSPPLSLSAIDHLPTLLPRESSEVFAAQLLPFLRNRTSATWQRCDTLFQEKSGVV